MIELLKQGTGKSIERLRSIESNSRAVSLYDTIVHPMDKPRCAVWGASKNILRPTPGLGVETRMCS
jgi:hypothetical protein